jgi:hypothetical protein
VSVGGEGRGASGAGKVLLLMGREGECEGRGQAHHTQYSTELHATHATPLRTVRLLACLLASFLACLLGWDGMGWDGMVWDSLASTIVLWGVFESRSQTQVPSPVAGPALLPAAIIHRASCEGDIRFACHLTGIKIHHHY